jgi:hypothetical protein
MGSRPRPFGPMDVGSDLFQVRLRRTCQKQTPARAMASPLFYLGRDDYRLVSQAAILIRRTAGRRYYSNDRSTWCYDLQMAAYLPPGWPTGVHPPGSEGFEATAIAWLLDVVPPDFRLHGVLRRHPMALATMARHHTQACVEGARAGYRSTRTELGETIPPHAIDAVLAAYRTEGRRLAATARAVVLVERALHGETFAPKL